MRAVLFIFACVCPPISVYAKQSAQPISTPFEPLATLLLALNPSAVTVTPKMTRNSHSFPRMSDALVWGEIAKQYMEVVFALSKDEGRLAEVNSNLVDIRRLFDSPIGQNITEFLSQPGILVSKDIKKGLVTDFMPKAIDALDPLVTRLLLMLVDRERMGALPSIIEQFEEKYRLDQGIVICKVTSAVELTKKQKDKLVEAVQSRIGADKTIWLATKTDKSMLDGLQVSIPDESINVDLSKAEQLKKLQAKLTGDPWRSNGDGFFNPEFFESPSDFMDFAIGQTEDFKQLLSEYSDIAGSDSSDELMNEINAKRAEKEKVIAGPDSSADSVETIPIKVKGGPGPTNIPIGVKGEKIPADTVEKLEKALQERGFSGPFRFTEE